MIINSPIVGGSSGDTWKSATHTTTSTEGNRVTLPKEADTTELFAMVDPGTTRKILGTAQNGSAVFSLYINNFTVGTIIWIAYNSGANIVNSAKNSPTGYYVHVKIEAVTATSVTLRCINNNNTSYWLFNRH